MDALASRGDEGRGRLRQAAGSRQRALIRGFPNGETHSIAVPPDEFNSPEGATPREVKHLSTWRRRNQERLRE